MDVEPIFKAYDIRGIYPTDVNTEVAYALGRAYAEFLRETSPKKSLRVAVGRDMRASSPELKGALIEGILDDGVNVEDFGMVSTPTFYFGVAYFKYDGGVQVSASHNPKEWNGFKLVRERAIPITKPTGMERIREAIEKRAFARGALPHPRGSARARSDILETEVEEFTKNVGARSRSFTIAIDPANGMGGPDMRAFFKVLPDKILWMNEMPDGTFPSHPPDPLVPENLVPLKRKVLEEGCDLGIASDGDGDRYFFVDEKGEVAPPEILRGIIAAIELDRYPGARIVYDVRPGKITRDMVEEGGGVPVLAPVGHSLIKEKMLVEDAVFGAESSGHYFYKLPYGTFEAPFLLLSTFLSFFAEQGKPLSEIVAPLKKYSNSGEINTRLASREAGAATLEEIKHRYADGVQSSLDGLSVEYPSYWFNVRLSNTEPLIRCILEARDEGTMMRERDRLMEIIAGS